MTIGTFFAYLGIGTVAAVIVIVVLLALENLKDSYSFEAMLRPIIIAAMIAFGIYAVGFTIGSWLGI